MIDTKRIHKIRKQVKETSQESLDFFAREFDKFHKLLSDLVGEYEAEIVGLNKSIVQEANKLRQAQEEFEKVSEILEANKDKLKELDEKSRELDEKEKNLLELHKVLTNKQKMLDAKDKILSTKERRINGTG